MNTTTNFQLSGNTILITGGSTGIGLTLAKRLMAKGNTIIVCGRSQEKLDEAAAALPGLHTYRCDVSEYADRLTLVQYILENYPAVNVLYNNAGVMRYPQLDTPDSWEQIHGEIATNLEAPIHLTLLFAEHLQKQPNAAILNTTSGLSHVPLTAAPVYSATKAALNSFTISLRAQFAEKGIHVIEVSPPLVNTDLGFAGRNTAGMPLDEFADAVMTGLEKGETEITCGFSSASAAANKAQRDELFKRVNGGQ